MINVFCTRKAETFLKVKKKSEFDDSAKLKWQCHLLPIAGKKSLFFIDKETMYKVLLTDVKKKDLENINQIFYEEFLKQLTDDGFLIENIPIEIIEQYKTLTFFETDNDRKIMGYLNDAIHNLKANLENETDKLKKTHKFKRNMNYMLLGQMKYATSKELLKQKLIGL